jgi:octaprenyl-diphosphate synthase
MSEVEIHQLLHRGDLSVKEADYMEIIERKTASLIQAACQVGALLAEAPDGHVQALSDYGYHLGVAFQMADDLLDYTADASEFGKAVGTDLREGKLTLPMIHALARADAKDRGRLEAVIGLEGMAAADFDEALGLIKRCGGIEYTKESAQEHIKKAKTSLEPFSVSKSRIILEQMADYVLVRKM